MAKRSATKLAAGAAARVKGGISLPEFPDISIAGWSGTIMETKGRGATLQYIVQWDADTIDKMPQTYRDHCEEHGLFYEMVCLPKDDVEPMEP